MPPSTCSADARTGYDSWRPRARGGAMTQITRVVLGVIGVGLTLISGCTALLSVSVLNGDGPDVSRLGMLVLAVVSLAFTAGGVWMAYTGFRGPPGTAPL